MQVINTQLPMMSKVLDEAAKFTNGNMGMVARMFRLPRKSLRRAGKPLGYIKNSQRDWH